MRQYTVDDVRQYYRETEQDYRLAWSLERNRALHYGYWDHTTWTFPQALRRTNEVLSGLGGILPGDTVLDAGCGVGGSSLWLAKHVGCTVHGITVSPRQVELATQFAGSEKLSSVCQFSERNYLDTKFPPQSFSVVWALESVCHASDKALFLQEASRLLKPQGRLVMCDFFRETDSPPGLQGDALRHYRGWADGWAVNDFAAIDTFRDSIKRSGLAEVTCLDVTDRVAPLARRQYVAFFPGYLCRQLMWLFGQPRLEYQRKNLWAAFHQYKALRLGAWRYYMVVATKR